MGLQIKNFTPEQEEFMNQIKRIFNCLISVQQARESNPKVFKDISDFFVKKKFFYERN